MRYETEHAPCGTAVADELPDGYPVDQGVGLWCPRCRVSFWSTPADAAPVADGAAPVVADTGPSPAPADPAPALEPAPAQALAGPSARLAATGRGPALRLRTVLTLLALPALIVAGLVIVLTASGGDDDAQRPAPAPPPPAATTVAPEPTASIAAPEPRSQHRVAGVPVSLAEARGWTVAVSGRRLVARGPGAARVTVSAAPRDGRSLRRLGRDVRADLRAGTVRRVQQGGRPAVRVRGDGREITALVLGTRRWVIARAAAGGGVRIARSVRIG